jgi:hypothetical protein
MQVSEKHGNRAKSKHGQNNQVDQEPCLTNAEAAKA